MFLPNQWSNIIAKEGTILTILTLHHSFGPLLLSRHHSLFKLIVSKLPFNYMVSWFSFHFGSHENVLHL